MSDKSHVSDKPLLPNISVEKIDAATAETSASEQAADIQQQNTELENAPKPVLPPDDFSVSTEPAPAVEAEPDTLPAEQAIPYDDKNPLFPHAPEEYTVAAADEYISDMDKLDEEAVAEAGDGDGGGTDDDDNDLEEDEEDDDAEETSTASTLTDHFRELRNRLIKIFLGIIVGFLICWGFSGFLADLLYLPLVRVLPADGSVPSSIIFTGIAEGFFTHMKLAIVAGIFVVSPFIFYQIWSFIAPGLYDNEKKFIIPVAVFSALCFIMGGCFCYFVVFPNAFKFFMTYSDGPFKAMPSMREYFSFTMQLILAFGMVFELPLFTFFLARMGLVTASAMRRFRRYFIVLSFVLAAVLTPPDVISQLLMAAPMLVLYEASIFIAVFFGKKEPKKADASEEDEDSENDDDTEQAKAKA